MTENSPEFLALGQFSFLATVFEAIDLSPLPGEVSTLLPRDFWASGFQDTVLVGDCTETGSLPLRIMTLAV